jgi:DNA-binding GntR family transcriptional regulator
MDITRVNAQFHGRIAAASRNEYVRNFSERLHNHARRLSYFIYHMESGDTGHLGEQQAQVAADHNLIVAAINGTDRPALLNVLSRHSRLFQQRIVRFVDSTRGLSFDVASPGERNE